MGKSNLKPGFKRYELKAGFEGLRWGGMFTEGDPSAVPRGKLRLLINGRPQAGEIRNRAGLSKFSATPFKSASACIRSVYDFQIAKPVKLWILGDGCPGVSSSAGFYIGHLDQEQSPEFQRAVYYDTAVTSVVYALFDEAVHIATDASLRKLQLLRQPYGTEAISLSGNTQDTPIKTFSGYTIRCMFPFDGKLFIGLDNGAASKIVTWDGLSFRDDLTGINPPLGFALYHAPNGGDALVVGFAAATNLVKYRTTGSSPGTWTNQAPTAGGPIATPSTGAMVAYKDVLYIADGGTAIWAYDIQAGTLAVVRSPASATAVRALTVFNGLLYFGYETAASARIGKYDGTTWTDVEKNITTQFTGAASVRALAAYRGTLIAAGVKTAAGGRLWISPGTATTGTFVEVIPNAIANGDVNGLLVA